MNLRTLLARYTKGELSVDDLQRIISVHSIERVANNIAQLDVDREIRKEIPEVIFAKGKEYSDLLEIAVAAAQRNDKVVVSKIQREELPKLCRDLKKRKLEIEVGKKSSTILICRSRPPTTTTLATTTTTSTYRHHYNIDNSGSAEVRGGKMGILAAGTSDIGVAEEARLMAKAMGCATVESYDVGIAGIHRLFPALKEMISEKVGAIVVVAGMEGALASVVTSMVNVPVIGVPTSVGYGFGSDGAAALASMLQSCTPGMAVVNIDNGIGAGAFAALICNQLSHKTTNYFRKGKNKNNDDDNNNDNKRKEKKSSTKTTRTAKPTSQKTKTASTIQKQVGRTVE